jgi:hypothetical protein
MKRFVYLAFLAGAAMAAACGGDASKSTGTSNDSDGNDQGGGGSGPSSGGNGGSGNSGNAGGGPECSGSADCDDNDECTDDICNNGTCSSTPVECDDGMFCNGTETCDTASGCVAGTPPVVDDGVGCTVDSCDEAADMVLNAADDNLCTDDGNPCTAEVCNPVTDCQSDGTGITADCDDGSGCTGSDACQGDAAGTCAGFSTIFEDFNNGAPGWTHATLGSVDGWVLGNLTGGSAPMRFPTPAFGTPNQGGLLGEEQSYLQSPVYDLSQLATSGGTVAFDTLNANEGPGYDLEFLEVSYDGGTNWSILIDSPDPGWVAPNWHRMSAVIPGGMATATTTFRFRYDTVDGCCGPSDVVGWFVDDFAILPAGVPDCGDGNICTANGACDPATQGCAPLPAPSCDDGGQCNGPDVCDTVSGCEGTAPPSIYVNWQNGAAGYTEGTVGGVNTWNIQGASGGSAPFTFASLAYGAPNNGGTAGFEHSFLQSPVMNLTGGATLAFYSWISNEGGGFDAEFVEVSYNGGVTWSILVDNADPRFLEDALWHYVEVAIPAAQANANTRIRFRYNTGDGCCGPTAQIGWFVDDIVITPAGAVSCNDMVNCTLDVCTVNCMNTNVVSCVP